MNQAFLISNIINPNAEKVNNWYFSGSYSKYGKHLFYFSKTLYELEKSEEEYFDEFVKEPVEFVKKRKGDFIVWDYNAETDELFFATDRMGKDNIFYYDLNNDIVITNNFWEGTLLLPKGEEAINWRAVKETIIYGNGLFDKTIINNYRIVSPGTYGIVSQNEKKITFYKYWEMTFIPQDSSMSDTIDKIYRLFNNTFQLLKQKYDKTTRFGVGLSGGWDSRLIVTFAQKYNLNIVPYCIGEKYRFGFIKTNGYRVSKRLAKYFGLDNFVFIEYSSETYLQKVAREVELVPTRASNIEIGCLSSLPDFDVMLNGEHGGVFFGEFDYSYILNYTKNKNMEECLLNLNSFTDDIKMIMDEKDINDLKQDTNSYIASLNTNKRWEIFYKYFFEVLGSKTKNGFFETNYGEKPRYTMYLNPEFVDEYLTWDPLFSVNRILQQTFLKKYFPELSRIPDETTDAPLYWRNMDIRNVPIRFLYAIKNYIFKSSLRRGKWLKRDKEFRRLLQSVYRQNEDLIKRHFPNLDIKKYHRDNPRATANLVKVLIVIDAFLNKKEDKFRYIMDKYSK